MLYGEHLNAREISTRSDSPRCRSCAKRASVEVFTSLNQSRGYFCLHCGRQKLKELEQEKA